MAVLKLLIRYRCKEAEKIQKALVVENIAASNGKKKKTITFKQELYNLFPPRSQWVHISYVKRKNLSQRDKNEKSLLLTVLRERQKEGSHPEWYVRLNERINHIVDTALTSKKLFSKPKISVIEKKRNEAEKIIECRPICTFKTLDERIYASLYNQVFTRLFDSLFYRNSMAFRVPQKGDPQMLHLNAIREIKKFRTIQIGTLWVAECDLKKFYDTLDHDIIKKRFKQFLLWKKQEGIINIKEMHILTDIIYSYVDCYNFYRDVYKYNKKPNHPIWKHLIYGDKYRKNIKWILDDIKKKRESGSWCYRTKKHEKYQLGIPQGGALSGIIANVLMHFTDMHLRKFWESNQDFLYIRFCDDIIMIGKEKSVIENAFEQYKNSIETSHLYMHPGTFFDGQRMKDFWDGKTRLPYQWGEPNEDTFPWITFVGYDINWKGDTRIRKTSVRKEIKKQYEKRIEIEHLLKDKKPQWAKSFISNSVHKRMIGMSVGRVPIWNYKNFRNAYSWAKAFTELTDNSWSRSQLRLLDRHRNQMIKKLDKYLLTLNYDAVKPSNKKALKNSVWYYGKPFSYYGQVLKKWK